MQKYNPIIHGRQGLEHIVSIEPSDESLEIFLETEAGVQNLFLSNRYWILSPNPITEQFVKLNGSLYYQYGVQFINRQDFLEARKQWRHKDIFSIYDPTEAAMVKDGYSNFLGMQIEDVSVLSFDIETTTLDPNASDAKVLLISNTYKSKDDKEQKLFSYDDYKTPVAMIDAWCQWVLEKDPSILLGHNIFGFDIPYLHTIASKYNTSLKLGRDESNLVIDNYERKFRYDGSRDLPYFNSKVYGRQIIDTYFLAMKADIGRQYESYGLKKIIEQEGWRKEGRVLYDASTIRTNYLIPKEWEKIKQYCKDDSEESLFLYEKFSPPFFYFAQSVPKSFQSICQSASGSQLNSLMMRIYLQEKHSLPKAYDTIDFEGAISLGNAGIYKNVFKVDVASLYPSIMHEYKIFPKEKDPNNHFSYLVEYFRTERLKNKQLFKDTGNILYNHLSESGKIFINSLYGFLGAPGLLFNDPFAASEVTRIGRETLTKAIQWAQNEDYQIVNADTDSIAFCFKDQSFFTPTVRTYLTNKLNSLFPENISWEPDGYYTNFIVLKAKNYVMKKEDGKVKYKGSALKSPTLEPACNELIHKMIDSIFTEQYNYKELYDNYIKEACSIKDIKRWAKRITISDKTLESERTNESKIRDAIEGTEYKEGDRLYVYFREDESLGLVEKFDGCYNKVKMLEKVFKTVMRFEPIIPNLKEICRNMKLKKNQKLLEEML